MTGFSNATNKQCNISTLSAPIGVQFIQNQEAQAASRIDERLFKRPGEQQFQHDIIGQQDIWGITCDLLTLLVRLLARVALEPHRFVSLAKAKSQELLQFSVLAVAQGIHRINDDCLNAFATAIAKHMVNDRDDVRETLSRTCSRRQNIVLAGTSLVNGIHLMPVQTHR